MKFSLVTCIAHPHDLTELHRSILAQTHADWEWIIAPAPGVTLADFQDARIRILRSTMSSPFSGALRKIAFGWAQGDILVELAPDDFPLENCLTELAAAFGNSDAGFVYSNFAILAEAIAGLGEGAGWQHRPFDHRGRRLAEVIAFEPSAASLAFSWYMPGPLCAWKKSAYDAIGGHDSARDIVDDQELLIRTYLAVPIKHFDKPLCVSRGLGKNPIAQTDSNKRLWPLTIALYYEYAYRLAEREADLRGLAKIDLCGGFGKPAGYISLDQFGGDISCDLNLGIPLPADSVGVVRAHDAIEHLRNPIVTMTEIHRVLADGGWATIMVPSTDGRGAFQDPTHVSFWNENSFWYWTRTLQAQYIRNDKAKFQAFRLQTLFPSEWHRQSNIPYVSAHLRAVKSNARRPHFQTV